MLIIFIVIALVSICFNSEAQQDSLRFYTEGMVEDLIEDTEAEEDNSELYELIEYYINNPLDLNRATLTELSALPYSDVSTARNIIDHRQKYGTIFSKNELYSIPAIPQGVAQQLLPFVKVADSLSNLKLPGDSNPEYFAFSIRSRILMDLQPRKGFQLNKYIGSPYKIYNRMKFDYSGKIEFGLSTDKDAGESSYFDFYSGYVSLSNWLGFDKIIVGDYLFEFGQGLALWSPYGFSKGSEAVYPLKKHSGKLKPYTSASENRFFRGAGVEYTWEHIKVAGFYSRNLADAHLDSIGGYVTSSPLDGMHRTSSELSSRKTIQETAYGLNLNYTSPESISAGFLYYTSLFNHSFMSYNMSDVNMDKFSYYSTYIDVLIFNFNIFSELSLNGKSLALVSGLQVSLSPKFSYILMFRNYPINYINIHGYSFGESSGAGRNEIGIYNGFRWRTPYGILNFYYDEFRFPNATIRTPFPSSGNEFMLNFSSKLSKRVQLTTRIKYENKEVSIPLGNQDQLLNRIKQSFRIELNYNFSKILEFRTRGEYANYFIRDAHISEDGYLFFEDVRIQPAANLLIYGRAIFFSSDSYNTALYECENDLTGIMSNSGLYGEGIRFYVLMRYEVLKKIYLSFKYSETYKPGVTSMGTGYQAIAGNTDNRFGMQLDINL